MKSTKLTLFALGCGTIFALMQTTGCNNQPASPADTTSGSSTPGLNNKIPEKTMMPDTIETRLGKLNFENGYPTEETARKLFDERDYQRAVQAYLWVYPAVSFESIRMATNRDLGADTRRPKRSSPLPRRRFLRQRELPQTRPAAPTK